VTRPRHSPSSIERQLLTTPRREAGVDSQGEPVRLGERDSSGHLVGYIDHQGLAWESLIERTVAVHGQQLADAMALANDDPGLAQRIDEALAPTPDELLGDIVREAAGHLAIEQLRQPLSGDSSG
jgi:hypothetical protein